MSARFPLRLRLPVVGLLSITAMIGWLNGAALGPFLPDISRDLNTSVPVLGQVTTTLFVLAAIVSLFVGPVADARGARRLLIGGLLTVVICSVGTALATGYWTLLVMRLTGAVSAGTLGGVSMAVAATMFEGDARRRAISWVVAGVAGGAVVGIPLLTAIGAVAGWRAAFVALGVLALLVALLVRSALPADARHDTVNPGAILSAYMPLARSTEMLGLYVASGLRTVSWMGFLVYAGAFFHTTYGLSAYENGWVYMAGGATFFAGIRWAGVRLGDRPLRPVFVATSALTGSAVGVMLIVPMSLYACLAVMCTASLLLGISNVCLSTMLAAETPAGRGTTMSLNAAVIELGTGVGAGLGGALIAIGNYPALGAGLFVLSAASAALVQRGTPSVQQRVPASTTG